MSSFSELYYRILGTNGKPVDAMMGFIDKVREKLFFAHFVGMLIAPCFKLLGGLSTRNEQGLKQGLKRVKMPCNG